MTGFCDCHLTPPDLYPVSLSSVAQMSLLIREYDRAPWEEHPATFIRRHFSDKCWWLLVGHERIIAFGSLT